MKAFFKTLGLGALYTVLLPFILVFLALYGVYCLGAFIYIAFKCIITFFKGGTPLGDLPEDVEAKRILMQKENETQAMAAAQVAAMQMMQQQYQNFQANPYPQQYGQPQGFTKPMFNPEEMSNTDIQNQNVNIQPNLNNNVQSFEQNQNVSNEPTINPVEDEDYFSFKNINNNNEGGNNDGRIG